LRQVNTLTGVSLAAIRAELKKRAAHNGNGHATAIEMLVQAWNAASETDRETALGRIGVGAVWDILARLIA
jgi:hypothetical protein